MKRYSFVDYKMEGSNREYGTREPTLLSRLEKVAMQCPQVSPELGVIEIGLHVRGEWCAPLRMRLGSKRDRFYVSLEDIYSVDPELAARLDRLFTPRPRLKEWIEVSPPYEALGTDPRLENPAALVYMLPPSLGEHVVHENEKLEKALEIIKQCPAQEGREKGNILFAFHNAEKKPEVHIVRIEDAKKVDPELMSEFLRYGHAS